MISPRTFFQDIYEGNMFPDVTFWMVLERRPLYYLFNLMLPCIFITSTAMLVFYLPPESGEKVNMGVTVLLALTVFLLLVAESMPPQSKNIPLAGKCTKVLASGFALRVECLTGKQ